MRSEPQINQIVQITQINTKPGDHSPGFVLRYLKNAEVRVQNL